MFHIAINLNHFQYIQIAEIVLSKLPSTMQLPETRRTNHELRDTRILSTTEETEHDEEEKEEANVNVSNNNNSSKAIGTDRDMV